ncbi:MAG: hypothetical protein NTV79_00355, partial [Candidatus Aureabacteria bacterium]|nr:hypothetical protein [Candidatus Auribacterota bacterium]
MDNVLTRCRSDGWALLILALGILLLFLPVAAGWRGIFQDDQAMAEFPWHYFLAANFQKGEIPLWDQHTWCGAIPFYARYYADTYYFPLWPFYLLARPANLDQAYWMISLLPLLVHYLLAAAGMYLFLRLTVRLRPLSSLAGAWVYVFSPAFSYSYVWFPIVAVQAWLPWLLVQVVGMDRHPGWGRVARAGMIIALMSLAAQPPHLGYGLLFAGLLSLGLALRRFFRGEFRAVLRAPLLLAVALALGILLSAVYWLPALDGQRYTEQHIALTYENVTGGDGSLPPLYLATLFAPDLFGSVDGRHIWGVDITDNARYWEANLSGGLLLLFLMGVGLLPLRNRRGLRRLRFWSIFSAVMMILALFCVLGRHTPFYRLFFKAIPVLSQFPFPIRYRMIECVAGACLAALGTEVVAVWRRDKPWPARAVWGYLGTAAAAV